LLGLAAASAVASAVASAAPAAASTATATAAASTAATAAAAAKGPAVPTASAPSIADRSSGLPALAKHLPQQDEVNPLAPFERVKVAGQAATTALANLPTQAEAGAVMGTSFVEVGGYYVSQRVASAGALPGLRSRVVGEYVGRSGDGFFGVTVAEYSSAAFAAKAMRAEAKDVGVTLTRTGTAVPGPVAWATFDTWAGTTADGAAGMAFVIAGPVLIRMTLSPAKGPWNAAQWERAWDQARSLQVRMMLPGTGLSPPSYLLGLIPDAAPAGLNPIAAGTRSRDGWTPSGKIPAGLYQSMRPVHLTLQYAIAGAAPHLLLQVVVAPTSKPAMAQEFVASLLNDPASVGQYPIEGLPPGAVTISLPGESGIDAIHTQFVGDGTLVDISCSGVTLAPAIQPALDACAQATVELSRMFRR